MGFRLSSRSLKRLDGVDPDLVQVVKYAIEETKIDFGVIEGVRSVAKQEELVASEQPRRPPSCRFCRVRSCFAQCR